MIAYHINGTSADRAEMNINQTRADELAAHGWIISDSPIVWAEKQYVGGELVDIPKPAEPEPYVPTETELLAQAKQSKLWQIESKLATLDRYLPRALEDFWTAETYKVKKLPQVQQDRLAEKAALRAKYAAVESVTTISEVESITWGD